MRISLRKLSKQGESEYEILFDTDAGAHLRSRCRISRRTSEPQIEFDSAAPQSETINSAELGRAVLSFHRATLPHDAPTSPPTRNAPPWFDARPLQLLEIETVGDAEYELRFVEPDGEVKTIRERVIPMNRGDFHFLGVNTFGDQKLISRIYPQEINAATVDFHRAVLSARDKQIA